MWTVRLSLFRAAAHTALCIHETGSDTIGSCVIVLLGYQLTFSAFSICSNYAYLTHFSAKTPQNGKAHNDVLKGELGTGEPYTCAEEKGRAHLRENTTESSFFKTVQRAVYSL